MEHGASINALLREYLENYAGVNDRQRRACQRLLELSDKCKSRSGRSVLFLKAVKLFRTLQAARGDNSREAELRRLLAPDLLNNAAP